MILWKSAGELQPDEKIFRDVFYSQKQFRLPLPLLQYGIGHKSITGTVLDMRIEIKYNYI